MKYYSTGNISDGILRKFGLEEHGDFLNDVLYSKNIYIISAFYCSNYLIKLCESARKTAKIEFIFPLEKGSNKKPAQRIAFENLTNSNKNVSVRTVDSSCLLHTKMYIFVKKDECAIWIGSSNASYNSVNNCEELMVRFKYSEWPENLKNYYNSIKRLSSDFKENIVSPETKGINDFFNQGCLFVKTSEVFNPTIELDFAEHKDPITKALMAGHEADASSLFIKATNRISLFKLMKQVPRLGDVSIPEEEKSPGAEGIKKLGLSTCYGLWIPDGYRLEAERILYGSRAANKKKENWASIHEYLVQSKSDGYKELLGVLKSVLETLASKIGVPSDTFYRPLKQHEHCNIQRLKRKIDYSIERLSQNSSKTLIKLLLNPYHITGMPNIWDDDLARADFYQSFCDSFCAESERNRKGNLLYQSIINFKDNDINEAEEFLANPEAFLKELLCTKSKRWFCQYDLRKFYAFNSNKRNYRILPFSNAPENIKKRGTVVFESYDDYLLRGEIEVIRSDGKIDCVFEDESSETYSKKTSKLVTIQSNF